MASSAFGIIMTAKRVHNNSRGTCKHVNKKINTDQHTDIHIHLSVLQNYVNCIIVCLHD